MREDRDSEVVPTLTRLHERSVKVVDNLVEVTALSRMFHEAIVDLCGTESLAIMAGALESLWSSHEADWARRDGESAAIPRNKRLLALDEHRILIEQIVAGDAEGARATSLRHLQVSQTYPSGEGAEVPISPASVRSRFIASSS